MQLIKRYWHSWIRRRFKMTEKTILAQRDVFVFFNKEGYLYLLLLLITFIAGINYGNNLVLALCFLLASILVLSFYLAFKQLYGLSVAHETAELGQVGQALTVKFNFTPLKQHLHLHLRFEYAEQAKKVTVLSTPLTIEFQQVPQQRGRYQFERLYFYSVYPFGIIRAWSYAYLHKEMWICPEPLMVNLTQFGFNANPQDQNQGIEDFSHLRAFQQGDTLNRIAWQQLAKGRGVLVKQFEENEQQHMQFDYADMPATLHEQKLGQLMFLIQTAYEQQNPFALKLPSQQLLLGEGEQHYLDAKFMLAKEP